MEIVDPFEGVQPGDAQRDAIRVAELLGAGGVELLTDEQIAGRADLIRLRALRSTMTRQQAVDAGARIGENEADRRGDTGLARDQRVARAKAYAAWEYDGKPTGRAHLDEFGVGDNQIGRVVRGGADLKKGGK